MTKSWTKTEARRRMKVAAKLAAETCGYDRRAALVEVGLRRMASGGDTLDAAKQARATALAAGDDHFDFCVAGEYVPELVGEMVNFFVRPKPSPYCDISGDFQTVVVWLGAGSHEPMLAERYS